MKKGGEGVRDRLVVKESGGWNGSTKIGDLNNTTGITDRSSVRDKGDGDNKSFVQEKYLGESGILPQSATNKAARDLAPSDGQDNNSSSNVKVGTNLYKRVVAANHTPAKPSGDFEPAPDPPADQHQNLRGHPSNPNQPHTPNPEHSPYTNDHGMFLKSLKNGTFNLRKSSGTRETFGERSMSYSRLIPRELSQSKLINNSINYFPDMDKLNLSKNNNNVTLFDQRHSSRAHHPHDSGSSDTNLHKSFLNKRDSSDPNLHKSFLNKRDSSDPNLHKSFLNKGDSSDTNLHKSFLNKGDSSDTNLHKPFPNKGDSSDPNLHKPFPNNHHPTTEYNPKPSQTNQQPNYLDRTQGSYNRIKLPENMKKTNSAVNLHGVFIRGRLEGGPGEHGDKDRDRYGDRDGRGSLKVRSELVTEVQSDDLVRGGQFFGISVMGGGGGGGGGGYGNERNCEESMVVQGDESLAGLVGGRLSSEDGPRDRKADQVQVFKYPGSITNLSPMNLLEPDAPPENDAQTKSNPPKTNHSLYHDLTRSEL